MPDELLHPGSMESPVDATSSPSECTLRDRGPEAAWVHLAGELNGAGVPRLEQTLRRAEVRAPLVVLDLHELTSIVGAGTQVIVDVGIRARQAGRRLIPLRGPPHVDRVFSPAGASDLVEIVDLPAVQPAIQALLRLGAANRARSRDARTA